MMAAYPHPGGMQHPGLPHGQPMGPNPNPGQPMAQQMQMHPGGVSGPNGPHVSQAGPMMAGMQPGGPGPGGPNAHALSHLTPQAQMMQQQQIQQGMANNPNFMLEMQQRRHQEQLFARQQMMQQQQAGGMNVGLPHGGGQFNPQQLAAMRANGQIQGVNLPAHLQNQLARNQQMQQAQQAQAQNMAHHLSMQQAASQQSNHSQQGGPGPQGQQGQQGQQAQQGPMRAQQIGGGQSAHSSPVPQPNQPQGPQGQNTQQQQQQAQQQQQQAQQQQQQQAQQQAQQQQAQQQQAQQQQQQQQAQQQQSQPQGGPPQNSQQQQQQQHAHQQLQAQRQAAMQQALMRQPPPMAPRMSGATVLKLLLFASHLGRFHASQERNGLEYWRGFASRFFSEDGAFRQTIKEVNKDWEKTFEVCFSALPRYFVTQFESGVENIQITIDDFQEKEAANLSHVESSKAKFVYWFNNQTHLICTGKLFATFNQNEKIEMLEFKTEDHQHFVSRSRLEELFAQASPKSPRVTKAPAKHRNQQRPQPPAEPSLTLSDIPEAPVLGWGVTPQVFFFLEISETLSHMQELITYQQQHPDMTPAQALDSLVATYGPPPQQSLLMGGPQQGQPGQLMGPNQPHPQMQLPPNLKQNAALQQQQLQHPNQPQPGGQPNGPPGTRTPSAAGGPYMAPGAYVSPHMANLGLPNAAAINGSPHMGGPMGIPGGSVGGHTPSPAQTHMQAPGMVAQHSHQGTPGPGSVAGGVPGAAPGASPNVTNKRRRASAVKAEDDGGDVNGAVAAAGGGGGARVKASPRVGGNKKIKGNPGGAG